MFHPLSLFTRLANADHCAESPHPRAASISAAIAWTSPTGAGAELVVVALVDAGVESVLSLPLEAADVREDSAAVVSTSGLGVGFGFGLGGAEAEALGESSNDSATSGTDTFTLLEGSLTGIIDVWTRGRGTCVMEDRAMADVARTGRKIMMFDNISKR